VILINICDFNNFTIIASVGVAISLLSVD